MLVTSITGIVDLERLSADHIPKMVTKFIRRSQSLPLWRNCSTDQAVNAI